MTPCSFYQTPKYRNRRGGDLSLRHQASYWHLASNCRKIGDCGYPYRLYDIELVFNPFDGRKARPSVQLNSIPHLMAGCCNFTGNILVNFLLYQNIIVFCAHSLDAIAMPLPAHRLTLHRSFVTSESAHSIAPVPSKLRYPMVPQ